MNPDNSGLLSAKGVFPQTSWSMIRHAQDPNAPAYRANLDTLIRKYWSPVYRHVKIHWARDPEEAKDLTQAYFLTFLEKEFLRDVTASKGAFRNFVHVSLRHFLTNWRRDARALKRRPAEGLVSLEAITDKSQAELPAAPQGVTPDEEFQTDWKRAVLDAALVRLREGAQAEGKESSVDIFVRYDLNAQDGKRPRYEDLASQFGLTVYQVTHALHWARQEFKRMVIQEIQDQVASQKDLREEAAKLMGLKEDE